MRTLGIILFIIWALLCYSWYTCRVQNNCPEFLSFIGNGDGASNEDALIKRCNPQGFNAFDGIRNLTSSKNQAEVKVGEGATETINNIVSFLKENPNQHLIVTGFYGKSETNKSEEDDLGLARAEAFRQLLVEKGIDEHRFAIEGLAEADLINKKGIINGPIALDKINAWENEYWTSTRSNPLGNELFNDAVNIKGYKGEAKINLEEANGIEDKIIEHLKNNPTQNLRIIGYALKDTSEQNLGTNRANMLKGLLSEIAPERIVVVEKLVDGLFGEATEANGILGLQIVKTDKSDENKFNTTVTEDTKMINFEYGKHQFAVGSDFENYVKELKEYLKETPDKKVQITGHTCNISSSGFNQRLSARRSQTLKSLLIDRGISSSKIVTKAMGENDPAFSNDSESGQIKNRRVEIEII